MEKTVSKKKKVIKYVIISVCIAVFLSLAGALFLIYADYSALTNSFEKVTLNIPKGANTDDIAQLLKENGAIKFPNVFKAYVRLKKAGGKFMRGEHEISCDAGYDGLIQALSQPASNIISVTIPEGFWQSQIIERFISKGLGNKSQWDDALTQDYDYDFLPKEKNKNRFEGYLFPATYNFYSDDTPETIINTLLSEFEKRIKKIGLEEKAQEMGLSLNDAVKLASIIQSEVPSLEEMQRVSAVFHNRLNIDMKLQSCVTVMYALGEHKSSVSIADTKTESPYNTYYVEGLPAGPICNPGEDALMACISPDKDTVEQQYLYFYTPKSNKVIYSKTYAEHKKAIAQNKGGTGTSAVG